MENILDIDKEMAGLSKKLTDIRFNEQRLAQVSSQIDEMISIHKTNIAIVLITIMSDFLACVELVIFGYVMNNIGFDDYGNTFMYETYLGILAILWCVILLYWGTQNKYGNMISVCINIATISLPHIVFCCASTSCSISVIHCIFACLILAILLSCIYAIFCSYRFRKKVRSISATQSGEQI